MSTAPAQTYLAELDAISGTWDTDVGYLGGDVYPRSVLKSIACQQTSSAEYDLSRDYSRLRANAGVSDKSDADVVLRFEVALDGRVVDRWDARLGEVHRLSVDVRGALRLRLTGTYVAPDAPKCSRDAWWVFGDPVLVG